MALDWRSQDRNLAKKIYTKSIEWNHPSDFILKIVEFMGSLMKDIDLENINIISSSASVFLLPFDKVCVLSILRQTNDISS